MQETPSIKIEGLRERLSYYITQAFIQQNDNKDEFFAIYNSFPTATKKELRDAVIAMPRPAVVEIGGYYGEEFGLWVTQQNPNARVDVYNPKTLDSFAPCLFNELNRERVAKLKPAVLYDETTPEESINRLYVANGLRNIHFHQAFMTGEGLERIAASAEKPIFVSFRTPTKPYEMTSKIAAVVQKHNVHMILGPYLNDEIKTYPQDHNMARITSAWKSIATGKGQRTYDLERSKDARVYVAMSLYYALASAGIGHGQVYKNTEITFGFPFQEPCCFVSTIPPNK